MSHSFKKVWNVVSTVLVALVVLLAVALVGVRLVGLNTYVVLSGSMEPTYHTGSLLYVKRVDPQDLRVGDPITFMLNEDTVATHRIIEILPDEEDSSVLRFRTQGDANDAPDGTPVHYKNVIGKPVFSVPYLGYFANFVQNPPGLYFAIGFAVVLVLLVFLPDLLDDSGKKGKGKGAGEDPRPITEGVTPQGSHIYYSLSGGFCDESKNKDKGTADVSVRGVARGRFRAGHHGVFDGQQGCQEHLYCR